jgi:hypothetical protein
LQWLDAVEERTDAVTWSDAAQATTIWYLVAAGDEVAFFWGGDSFLIIPIWRGFWVPSSALSMQWRFLVGDAAEGSEVENMSYGKAEDGVEDNDHGAIENQHRSPYLAHLLSM